MERNYQSGRACQRREVEAGRVRVPKWVETEPVETSVELERETVHVSRERIDQPDQDWQQILSL